MKQYWCDVCGALIDEGEERRVNTGVILTICKTCYDKYNEQAKERAIATFKKLINE